MSLADSIADFHKATLDVLYRRGALTPRTKTGFLPRPVLVKQSDALAYVDQLDGPINSLYTDISGYVTSAIVSGASPTEAEKQILADYGTFWSEWKALAAEIRSKGVAYDSYAAYWPKLETAETTYRGYRQRWTYLGHSASQPAPPSKADISPPGKVSFGGFSLGLGAGVVLVGAGVGAYVLLRR